MWLLPLLLATAAGRSGASQAAPPVPGVEDVCGHLSAAERCSPEICAMEAHVRVQLEDRVYYTDREILLPEGAGLVGAGVNRTRIVSCGAPGSGRRTLILNNDSYLGHFTFQGLSPSRGNFEGAVGTPGCLATDCAPSAPNTAAAAAGTVPCFLRGGVAIAECPRGSGYDTWLVASGTAPSLHKGVNCYPGVRQSRC